jgi:hypothetical protein
LLLKREMPKLDLEICGSASFFIVNYPYEEKIDFHLKGVKWNWPMLLVFLANSPLQSSMSCICTIRLSLFPPCLIIIHSPVPPHSISHQVGIGNGHWHNLQLCAHFAGCPLMFSSSSYGLLLISFSPWGKEGKGPFSLSKNSFIGGGGEGHWHWPGRSPSFGRGLFLPHFCINFYSSFALPKVPLPESFLSAN